MNTAAARTLRGGCHCGQLSVALTSTTDPATVQPRACDCSFCRKHGAAWVSDPHGRLVVASDDPRAVRDYRQGSDTARFLLCDRCGVLVAVVLDDDGHVHGAVNATCLEAPGFAEPITASPQALGPAEKVARWRRLWTADVTLPTPSRD